ncbi:hypothetical protein HaLaN_02228 [Haematococcus lacustris]|uniref:Uncharacterized protein n=1 Tax=Haematococcus lacustris TaxID=44745 RepID=A0A699YBJ3_HAELA|nr:hypothetical protein HaLaN_02228 [Haematococcus lacustris]
MPCWLQVRGFRQRPIPRVMRCMAHGLASGVFEHLAPPPGNVVMIGPIDIRHFMQTMQTLAAGTFFEEGSNQLEALVSPDGCCRPPRTPAAAALCTAEGLGCCR